MKSKLMVKEIISWVLACAVAAVLVNCILFFYHRPTGWIDRTAGATLSIWEPNTIGLMGIEGRGIYHIDNKGYINKQLPLEDNYIIVVGSSYTQGKEVYSGKRYTDILNYMISETDDYLSVYNVSQDGYFFPDIVNGFKAIIGEFEDVDTIVIEIATTNFEPKTLDNACNQREYDSIQNGESIMTMLSLKKKISLKIKEVSPLLTLLKKQYESVAISDGEIKTGEVFDENRYLESLDSCLKLIRSEYDGNLIIMYHPTIEINENGKMIPNLSDTNAIFENLCTKNNITFVDMTQPFLEAYALNCSVPYGFNNTSMGVGHLNEVGHSIIANELYKILKGSEKQ